MNNSIFIIVGLFVLAATLLVAVILLLKALIATKTKLDIEVIRRADQEAVNAARQHAFDAQRASMRNEFGELAARLLNERQKNLAEANERSLEGIFRQFQERMAKYELEVEKASGENTKLGEHMKTQLVQLQNFADRAQAFTAALLGGNKIQGDHGEEILAGILERSGFQKGVQYDIQLGGADEGRPDVSIYDALNKHVILVDAKMNIKDYIAACNLPDDETSKAERDRALKAHVAGIRRQIDVLSAKNYAETVAPKREGYTNLPLVAMFCPFNAVLEAALNQDPTLMQYAYERKIVLVTPLTLWGYLWLVSWGWKQREVERKFDEIQELGRDVVSAVDMMLNDLENMGEALKKASKSYEDLYKRATVDKGQMSVRRVATKLMDYGIVPPGRLKTLTPTS